MTAEEPDDRARLRATDPDPLGLMNVIELIAPGARVTGWHQLHGGIGNVMHRIDVTMPSGSETGFVLRQAIPETGHPTDLRHEAMTLEALRPSPVPAPELLWLDQDGDVFGRPALAMTLLDGSIRSAHVTTDPTVVRALAEALVTLQWVVDLDPFDHLEVRRDGARRVQGVRTGALPDLPFADAAAVRDTLVAALPDLGPSEVSLCHGDFHVGNVLVDGPRPAGIVDWDHAHLGDPRTDLAYAAMDLAIFAGLEIADAFLAEYEALRGPVTDLDWWCLWATLRTWPGVSSWLPGWHEVGIHVELPTANANLAAWTDRYLARLRDRRRGGA